jgi:aminoglycoside 6'-N-acetyltransferase I
MADSPVRQADISDSAEIAEMCALLWPDATAAEHRFETEQLLKTKMCGTLPSTIFVSHDENGRITGFLLVDLRSHADGCNPARPVGYVEGWFVLERHRGQGMGAAMMRAAEDWARSLG